MWNGEVSRAPVVTLAPPERTHKVIKLKTSDGLSAASVFAGSGVERGMTTEEVLQLRWLTNPIDPMQCASSPLSSSST